MIYMNNAATGYPKFPNTIKAMTTSLERGILSPNRDSVVSMDAAAIVFGIRNELGKMLHAEKPHEIILTASDTVAINMIVFGMGLESGDAIIVDSMAHNAIARPAFELYKSKGVKIFYANTPSELETILLKDHKTIKAALFSHASNVTGDVVDVQKLADICFRFRIPFILDAAQSIGIIDINVEKLHASAVAFAGHKGLNGPQGTGGFYIRKGFDLNPILFGGNGSDSLSIDPPLVVPDSFEVGTPPMHDLVGLYFSIVEIVNQIGQFTYSYKLRDIVNYAYKKLLTVPNIVMYGECIKEIPVISFNIKGKKCKEVGDFLATKDIVCRTGIHCAALALQKMGVVEQYGGTVRVSFGYYNTKQEVDTLVGVLNDLSD